MINTKISVRCAHKTLKLGNPHPKYTAVPGIKRNTDLRPGVSHGSERTVLRRRRDAVDQVIRDDGTRTAGKEEEATCVRQAVAVKDRPPGIEASLT